MKSSQNWADATVEAIEQVTPTVREFRLRPQAGVRPFDPGSHLQLQVLVNSRPQTRSYSLVGAEDGAYRIAVKRLDDGRGGSLAMWRLAVGDRLPVSEPQNHFALDPTAPAYLVVAGGIGITPLLPMAQRLAVLAGKTGATLKMLYGARSAEELGYLAPLREALGERLHTFIGPEPVDFASAIAALPAGGQLYTCGPVPMLEALKRAWAQAGRPIADLRFETFGSSGRHPTQVFRVRVPRQSVEIEVPADTSLLDALEAAGVQTLSDCKRGECGLCAMDVLAVDGVVDHRDVFLTEQEKRDNSRICACVSRALGTVTLDSAWRPDAP